MLHLRTAQKVARAFRCCGLVAKRSCPVSRHASSASSSASTPSMTNMQLAHLLLSAAYPYLHHNSPHSNATSDTQAGGSQMYDRAVAAKQALDKLSVAQRSQLLRRISNALMEQSEEILMANREDIAHADLVGLDPMTCIKLVLSQAKLKTLADQLVVMADAPVPAGGLTSAMATLIASREPVADGIDLVAFDAQSDLLPLLVGMAIQSGTALILDGAAEAYSTNRALLDCINAAIRPEVMSGFPLVSPRDDVLSIPLKSAMENVQLPAANQNLSTLSTVQRRELLLRISKVLVEQSEEIHMANHEDLAHADLVGLEATKCQQLVLSQSKLKSLADRIAALATAPPSTDALQTMMNGLINNYEAGANGVDLVALDTRSDVLPQVIAAMILLGGETNAVVLEAAAEAYSTNRCLLDLITSVIQPELNANTFRLVRPRQDVLERPHNNFSRDIPAKKLSALTLEERNELLLKISKNLMTQTDEILMANREDLAHADLMGMDAMACKQLMLSQSQLKDLADQIAAMARSTPSTQPLALAMKGLVEYQETLPDGTELTVFGARPTVLPQLVAMAIHQPSTVSGLRLEGQVELFCTNQSLLNCINEAVRPALGDKTFQLVRPREDVPPTQRALPLKKRVELARKDLGRVLTPAQRSHLLLRIANVLTEQTEEILMANREDLAQADLLGLTPMLCTKLALSQAKLKVLADKIAAMADAPLPTGMFPSSAMRPLVECQETLAERVELVAFDGRPELLPQLVAMAIQSGCALLLEGAAEAYCTNRCLLSYINAAIQPELGSNVFQLVPPREDASL